MTLSKRERTLLVATVAALVLGGSYLLFVPLIHSWQTTGRDLIKQRQTLASYRATLARRAEWQADYDKLGRQFGQQMEQFSQTSDVLKKIEEVSHASGTVLIQQRPLQPLERDVYRELPVQCRIEATTESLVKFLYALRTGSGFVNVEQLQVAPRPDNPAILRCDILIHALAARAERPAS